LWLWKEGAGVGGDLYARSVPTGPSPFCDGFQFYWLIVEGIQKPGALQYIVTTALAWVVGVSANGENTQIGGQQCQPHW
jgi:hypothetical protein